MVQSNEFKGRRISDAVRLATAAYQRATRMERKDRCSDLAFELADFKRAASDALDEIQDLEREVDALRGTARRAALEAVVGAAIAASGGLGTAVKALRALRRLRKPDLNRTDWLSLVPLLGGGLLAAAKALEAVNSYREAERLAQKIEQIERRADALGEEILRIAAAYRRSGCAARDQVS